MFTPGYGKLDSVDKLAVGVDLRPQLTTAATTTTNFLSRIKTAYATKQHDRRLRRQTQESGKRQAQEAKAAAHRRARDDEQRARALAAFERVYGSSSARPDPEMGYSWMTGQESYASVAEKLAALSESRKHRERRGGSSDTGNGGAGARRSDPHPHPLRYVVL